MPRRVSGSNASSARVARSSRSTRSSRSAQSAPQTGAGNGKGPQNANFERYTGWRMLMNPLWCYHGFRIIVVILTVFGLIMVFSSSAVTMVAAGASPWSQVLSQGMYCIVGVIVALVLMHLPYRTYRKFSQPFLMVAMVLQLLTLTPLGIEVNGNRSWVGIPGVFQLQPAEVMKLALCVWLPKAMEEAHARYKKSGDIKDAYGKPALWYVAALLCVLSGKDLGTGLIIVAIGLAGFLIGGIPLKYLGYIGGLLGLGVIVLVLTSSNRMGRILATYQECSPQDLEGVCYQAMHAKYAMASGGLFGVGIGNSREKWNYLPEAHNDFIYAIIGEETGFIGALAVLVLFLMLGWCLINVSLHTANRYVSMALVCFTVWLVGQALVNMGVVIGIFPVMGVPLPFVSAGGSSLVMCLGAAGIADSMMRAQPEIRAEVARA